MALDTKSRGSSFKRGDLCYTLCNDYGWEPHEISIVWTEHFNTAELVKLHSVKRGTIVEVIQCLDNSYYWLVWVPQLSGYTVFTHGDLQLVKNVQTW